MPAAIPLIAAGVGAAGSIYAANQQAKGAGNAANTQWQMFNQLQQNESPWVSSGQEAQGNLNYLLGIGNPNGMIGKDGVLSTSTPGGGGYGSLLSPFTMDTFKQYSPAYQFQQQQGMQGVLNGGASGQGALSGAAQKDLMGYNQNLANTAFNNAFNQYQTQQGNIYNRLAGVSQLGQAAGSNQATGASTFGGNIGNAQYNIGSALAGGTVGATNNLAALPWLMGTKTNAPVSWDSSQSLPEGNAV